MLRFTSFCATLACTTPEGGALAAPDLVWQRAVLALGGVVRSCRKKGGVGWRGRACNLGQSWEGHLRWREGGVPMGPDEVFFWGGALIGGRGACMRGVHSPLVSAGGGRACNLGRSWGGCLRQREGGGGGASVGVRGARRAHGPRRSWMGGRLRQREGRALLSAEGGRAHGPERSWGEGERSCQWTKLGYPVGGSKGALPSQVLGLVALALRLSPAGGGMAFVLLRFEVRRFRRGETQQST